MQYILLILLISSFLFGCSDKKSIIKETGEITNGYVDTLESSIKDAKDIVQNENIRNNKLKEEIKKY